MLVLHVGLVHESGPNALVVGLAINNIPDTVHAVASLYINLEAATSPFWAYDWVLGGFPSSPWALTNTPVDYEPAVSDPSELRSVSVGNESLAMRNCYLQAEPARKLPKIASVPYLMLTGKASVHVTYDHCAVDFLKQAGGDPEYIKLASLGIRGNGHFFHLELNNLEIAEVVSGWINKTDHALA